MNNKEKQQKTAAEIAEIVKLPYTGVLETVIDFLKREKYIEDVKTMLSNDLKNRTKINFEIVNGKVYAQMT